MLTEYFLREYNENPSVIWFFWRLRMAQQIVQNLLSLPPQGILDLWNEMFRRVGMTTNFMFFEGANAKTPLDLEQIRPPIPKDLRMPQAALEFVGEFTKNKPRKFTEESLDGLMTGEQPCAAPLDRYVWVRGGLNADEVWKNHSAEMLWKEHGKQFQDLVRVLAEAAFVEFVYCGKRRHIDERTMTLCAGSLFSDGDVPVVDYFGGSVGVHRSSPRDAFDCLRARQAVF